PSATIACSMEPPSPRVAGPTIARRPDIPSGFSATTCGCALPPVLRTTAGREPGPGKPAGSGRLDGCEDAAVDARVNLLTVVALAVAVVAVSSSGPLVVLAAVPALAVAFWRNALSAGLLWPVALVRHRGEIAALGPGGAARS